MVERTITVDEIKKQDIAELLHEVVRRQERLTVILAGDEAVSIGPVPPLHPLPELEGRVPKGWKDGIYAE